MDEEELKRQYAALINQGLTHDQAMDRLRSMQGARPSVQREPESRGAVEEFGRGAALGLTEAGTSLAQGIGFLGRQAGRLIPGEDIIERGGTALERGATALEERAERALDPRGTAGSIGRIGGRILGEVGTTVGTLGAGKAGLARFAPRVLERASRLAGTSRGASALAATAAEAPLAAARAAGEAAEGRNIGTELALEFGGAALGGALVPFRQAGREAAEAAGRFAEVPVLPVAGVQRAPAGDVEGGFWAKARQFRDWARKQWIDDNIVIPLALRRGGAGDLVQRTNQLLDSRYSSGFKAQQAYTDTFDDAIRRGDDFLDTVSQYSLARRELDLRNRKGEDFQKLINRQTNEPFTTEELLDIIERGDQIEGVSETADKLTNWFKELLEMQYEHGLISKKVYDKIVESEDYYVPFLRSFEEAAGGQGRWYNRGFGPSPRLRKMKGTEASERDVINPFHVAHLESKAVFDAIAKQDLVNFLADAEGKGAFRSSGLLQRVPPNYKPSPEEYVITGRVKGKRRKYLVSDKEVYDALVGSASPARDNMFFKIARNFTRLKRATITSLPGFAALSIARDIPQYALQRQDLGRAFAEGAVGAGLGGATGFAIGGDVESALEGAAIGGGLGMLARPTLEVTKAASALASETKLGEALLGAIGVDPSSTASRQYLEAWKRNGGVTESFYAQSYDDSRKFLNELKANHRNIWQSVVNPGDWYRTLQSIGRIAERAPRVAEYRRYLESLGREATDEDIAEAILRSHDVTLNFAKRGVTGGKFAPYAAFLNAKLQGWDKLARMIATPETRYLGGAMILAPTIALWNINKDNPNYWERPEWEKNLFWLIPDPTRPDGFIRVPKPFELGTAFASSWERLLDGIARSGAVETDVIPSAPDTSIPDGLKGLVSAGLGFLTEEALIFPDLATPIVQQLFNYDIFRGRDIVPIAQQNLPGEAQYTERTGALPRMIGEATGFSPMRAEQLLSDVFGTVGRRVQDVIIDPAARAAGLPAPIEERPGRSVLSRALEAVGTERFRTQEQAVGQVEYDARRLLDDLNAKNQQLNKLVSEGATDQELQRFIEENRDDFELRNQLDDARIELDRLNRTRREISRNRSISDEERKRYIDEIGREAGRISRYILSVAAQR